MAGYDVFSQSLEVRRRIGYLPENAPLYPDLSVASYLDFVAEIKGVGRSARRGRVADVMERCFIADMQNRLIGKLSKGYRQRVGLAQALLGDPEVLILDEPTIGLDPRQIAEIRALIRSLAGQHTVILSTHILPEVSMVCDGVDHHQPRAHRGPGHRVGAGPAGLPDRAHRAPGGGRVGRRGGRRCGRVPGVVAVEPLAVARRRRRAFWSSPARDRDVRAELVRLVTGRGWALQELHQVGHEPRGGLHPRGGGRAGRRPSRSRRRRSEETR